MAVHTSRLQTQSATLLTIIGLLPTNEKPAPPLGVA
jgi:hypothetical protein